MVQTRNISARGTLAYGTIYAVAQPEARHLLKNTQSGPGRNNGVIVEERTHHIYTSSAVVCGFEGDLSGDLW